MGPESHKVEADPPPNLRHGEVSAGEVGVAGGEHELKSPLCLRREATAGEEGLLCHFSWACFVFFPKKK